MTISGDAELPANPTVPALTHPAVEIETDGYPHPKIGGNAALRELACKRHLTAVRGCRGHLFKGRSCSCSEMTSEETEPV